MIVNMHKAKNNFSKLVARFQRGEKIIVAKNGKPVLQFAPVEEEETKFRRMGFFGCKIDMTSFDDPIEGMEEYLGRKLKRLRD
jgi:prevent-host-death family protein